MDLLWFSDYVKSYRMSPSLIKFCANLNFMFVESSSVLERYALAKNAGFKAVETGFPVGFTAAQVKEAKERAGVEQILINLFTGDVSKGEMGVTFIPGRELEFQTNLSLTIDYAKMLNCSKLHIMAGKKSGEVTDDHWTTYENNLKYASNELQKAGIIGVIEPINNYSVPNYFLQSYDRAVDIIKRINSPHIRLMLDLFHMQQIRGDISHGIEEMMPYVGHVQIAQVPKRNEPNTPGEINYRYVLRLLEEKGYQGYVGLEYAPLNGTENGLTWIKEFGYEF